MIHLNSTLTVLYHSVNSRHEVTWSAPRYGRVIRVSDDGQRGELQCEHSSQRFWFTVDDIICEGREEESAEAVAERKAAADAHDRQQVEAGRLWELRNQAAKRGDTFAVWELERQLEIVSYAE